MRITLENTDKFVTVDGVPARIWEGLSDNGVPVICFVTRVAVQEGVHDPEVYRRFETELQEVRPASAAAQAFNPRLIL